MILTPELRSLLSLIRSKEAPKGYGQVYGGSPIAADVSRMTLSQVRKYQNMMLAAGSKSSACGGYQFIKKTLIATMLEMGLSGDEVWTPDLQDRMALHLMEKRKLSAYMAGKISREAFANNLAMEWASLPVVTPVQGAHRKLQPGQSYYAGDGLNKAHHDPKAVLAAIDALKSKPPLPDGDPGLPEDPIPQKRGILKAIIDLILAIFKRKA
jgi:muramidase (phage lysozyme)